MDLRTDQPKQPRRGFTMVEILVVIAIILLSAVIALPVMKSALDGRQAVDAATILTGALAGARDSAIRQNEPRGVRLLPDPILTLPALGTATAGTTQLAYNRIVPIEPAPDYGEGRINVGPCLPQGTTFPDSNGFPPAYPRPVNAGDLYPFYPSNGAFPTKVLMVEESPFFGGFTTLPGTVGIPNSPTNWYWNIRVGDKLKISGTGRAYTVVGPCTINPWATAASGNQGNPELFVNVGAPGKKSPLVRTYYSTNNSTIPPAFTAQTTYSPEFLFLVNGEDDSTPPNGFIDEGWDGYDEDGDGFVDGLNEWEIEEWANPSAAETMLDTGSGASPSQLWLSDYWQIAVQDVTYSIQRRPVPTPGAREILLPTGIVIDATSWNMNAERSRVPVQAGSLYVDIMLNPNGLYIPTTIYSTPTSTGASPFIHFWLADRGDVYARGSVWGLSATGAPKPNPAGATLYELPMTNDAIGGYPPSAAPSAPVLKNDRRLVTLFAQSGQVVTNTIDTIPAQSTSFLPGEGFNTADVNQPFYKAQLGQREVK